ncbi:MAG: hypothetical protein KF713_00305 [Turneriella sp.]|nr:hypothetical protein [Turneriella sp.]
MWGLTSPRFPRINRVVFKSIYQEKIMSIRRISIACLLVMASLSCGARQIKVDKSLVAPDPKQHCLVAAYINLGKIPAYYQLLVDGNRKIFEFTDKQPYILASVPAGSNFSLNSLLLGGKDLYDAMEAGKITAQSSAEEMAAALGSFHTATYEQWYTRQITGFVFVAGKLIGRSIKEGDLVKDVDLSILKGSCKGGFIWAGEYETSDYSTGIKKVIEFKASENKIVREEALKQIKSSLAGTAWEPLISAN